MSAFLSRRSVLAGLALLPTVAPPARAHAAAPLSLPPGLDDYAPVLQAALDGPEAQITIPAGRFPVRQSIYLRSGKSLSGVSAEATELLAVTDPGVAPFNLFTSQGPVQDIMIRSLTLTGGLSSQTPAPAVSDGQHPFGIYLRTGLSGFSLSDCTLRDFGLPGRKSGGGMALGPLPAYGSHPLTDIRVQNCRFSGNGNVPGVYIAGGIGGGSRIAVSGCQFTGVGGATPPQNAVYILGRAGSPLRDVLVADCGFRTDTPLDTGVEINWVEEFVVSDLSLTFLPGSGTAVGVLLRDGSRRGLVRRITLETEAPGTFGIALVDFGPPPTVFAPPGPIEEITLTDIAVIGPFARAIAIDRGSAAVRLAQWRVAANGAGGAEQALRFAACRDVTVSDGAITAARYPVLFAALSADIRLLRLDLENCGGDGPLVSRETPAARSENLLIADLAVLSPRPGSELLVDPALEARTP